MKAQESFETEIRERGQLTIPKKIREMSHGGGAGGFHRPGG